MPVPINRNRARPLGAFQQRVYDTLDGDEWRSVADIIDAFPPCHTTRVRDAIEGMFRRGSIEENYEMAATRYRRKGQR